MSDTLDLGQFGIWLGARDLEPEAAGAVEALGFGALWLGGSPPADLELVEAAIAASERIPVATGIVSIWSAPASELAASFLRIEARHPGRLLLGIGTSHPERWGVEAAKPYAALVAYLDALETAGVPRDRIVLAALGPRVMALAGERTRGAHPYLTTPAHSKASRAILGTGPLLAPEQRVVLSADPVEARRIGRPTVETPYLGLVNYRRNLLSLGYSDADLDHGGSDRLIDDLVVSGDDARIAARLREHLEAGADHVAIQLLNASDDGYRRLAAALGLRSARGASAAAGLATRRGGNGTTAEVVRWYSAYAGYFEPETCSVNTVEPMKSTVSSAAPITVHCSGDPAATAPKQNTTHHCAISKK